MIFIFTFLPFAFGSPLHTVCSPLVPSCLPLPLHTHTLPAHFTHICLPTPFTFAFGSLHACPLPLHTFCTPFMHFYHTHTHLCIVHILHTHILHTHYICLHPLHDLLHIWLDPLCICTFLFCCPLPPFIFTFLFAFAFLPYFEDGSYLFYLVGSFYTHRFDLVVYFTQRSLCCRFLRNTAFALRLLPPYILLFTYTHPHVPRYYHTHFCLYPLHTPFLPCLPRLLPFLLPRLPSLTVTFAVHYLLYIALYTFYRFVATRFVHALCLFAFYAHLCVARCYGSSLRTFVIPPLVLLYLWFCLYHHYTISTMRSFLLPPFTTTFCTFLRSASSHTFYAVHLFTFTYLRWCTPSTCVPRTVQQRATYPAHTHYTPFHVCHIWVPPHLLRLFLLLVTLWFLPFILPLPLVYFVFLPCIFVLPCAFIWFLVAFVCSPSLLCPLPSLCCYICIFVHCLLPLHWFPLVPLVPFLFILFRLFYCSPSLFIAVGYPHNLLPPLWLFSIVVVPLFPFTFFILFTFTTPHTCLVPPFTRWFHSPLPLRSCRCLTPPHCSSCCLVVGCTWFPCLQLCPVLPPCLEHTLPPYPWFALTHTFGFPLPLPFCLGLPSLALICPFTFVPCGCTHTPHTFAFGSPTQFALGHTLCPLPFPHVCYPFYLLHFTPCLPLLLPCGSCIALPYLPHRFVTPTLPLPLAPTPLPRAPTCCLALPCPLLPPFTQDYLAPLLLLVCIWLDLTFTTLRYFGSTCHGGASLCGSAFRYTPTFYASFLC